MPAGGTSIAFYVDLVGRAPGVAAGAGSGRCRGASTALSVGAVAAVFTAVKALLIEPLPYAWPDELVILGADYRHVREPQGDWVFRREA